jgi:signal transduction histidine kinase
MDTDQNNNLKFKFVQIKVKKIHEKNKKLKLIQVIDVSHKILYDETKAEHDFLELINASVSHELRNPLNSMIGHIAQMEKIIVQLEVVLNKKQRDRS